jgi:hypothetical protein
MMQRTIRAQALMLALAALVSCDGRSGRVGALGDSDTLPTLLNVEIGRLVDVYSYRRIDDGVGDRRIRTNRTLELIARNVVVRGGIESQSLFDAAGNAVQTANYEFLPFDKTVGHEQLVILWDDRTGPEQKSFQNALASAQAGLTAVPSAYRGQNTQTRPIPIVPRNAAIKLSFSGPVSVGEDFFRANPSVIQLLEFKGDPKVVQPADAFRILPFRVLPQGNSIVLDTTILAGEANGGVTSPGLPLSADNVTANIRVAIPARGGASPAFYVQTDPVADLNGPDSAGRNSVIRDFRSGNLADGLAGRLREPEPPMIEASLSMGILDVDTANGIVTVNKRLNFVPVRGRYPFVDGPLNSSRIPLGPLAVPTQRPLRSGDFLTQTVQVPLSDGTFEAVQLRAEVLENLEVGTVVGDPGQPLLGRAANAPSGTDQGEMLSVVRLRLSSLAPARDREGRLVSFQANTTPLGQDCILRARYVERVPFSGSSSAVSDAAWRVRFVRIEPTTSIPGTNVSPLASIAVEFTKPMDLDQVDNTKNLLVTSKWAADESFAVQMGDAKRATARVVPTRLSDLSGDATVLRLQPPMGFFHHPADPEQDKYSVHVRGGAQGVADLAGNPVDFMGDLGSPPESWSVDFRIAASAPANLVGWHQYLFEAEDEDGTLPGSPDLFGQFRLEGGRLLGATPVRFSRSADNQNLLQISRITRGECWDGRDIMGGNRLVPPLAGPPAGHVPTYPPLGLVHPGRLYWNARMSDSIGPQPTPAPQVFPFWQTLAQPVGRVIEPLKEQGSRMQMRYIEDDFSLSYTQPSEFALDVEQLYWSPFNDEAVLYDVFDRLTMSLAHARTRGDERWELFIDPADDSAWCVMDCSSMNSGLGLEFSTNVLPGTQPVTVFEDRVYKVNPNEAFRANQITYVPFPRFDRSYTWRDSRLVTVNTAGQIVGLGGSQQPNAPIQNRDTTANIDSPWITSVPDPEFVLAGNSTWVQDPADFLGNLQRDHDPIALPLLVDFKVFADGPANGLALAANGFQVAMLGPPSGGFPGITGGYYDRAPSGCGGIFPAWSRLRVHATGGVDLVTGAQILIDPANQLFAQSSVLKDAGLGAAATGLHLAPPGDGMLHWSRADFVRRVSTATFGFFDTLQPQLWRQPNVQAPVVGVPNLAAVGTNLRATDVVVQVDPPQARQPAGTSVVVELRGCETFTNSGTLYSPTFPDTFQNPSDAYDTRGNLLNPNYACEAYRYSTANLGGGAPRIATERLTKYVTEDRLSEIKDPATNLLPRFLNPRLVMTNNTSVTPGLTPSLRSMSIVYRLVPTP